MAHSTIARLWNPNRPGSYDAVANPARNIDYSLVEWARAKSGAYRLAAARIAMNVSKAANPVKETPHTRGRWEVITPVIIEGKAHAYQAIYSVAHKAAAEALADEWTTRTGKPAFVIPGGGHKTRRDMPEAGHGLARKEAA